MAQAYLDFLIEIGLGDGHTSPIAVRSAGAGEAHTLNTFPFTNPELEKCLLKVENAILHSAGRGRPILTPEEDAVRTFGQQLFNFILTDEPRSLYYECAREAAHQGKGVRVKLSIQSPTLAALPWEFLFDPRKRDYVCLDPNTPLVRYTELAQTVAPLSVTAPLRILGMVAAPTDLQRLDVAQEQQRVSAALQTLQARGLVELTWLRGQTWRDLQQIMRPDYGPWHIFHFIGHGLFDALRDEGRIALADEQGHADLKSATQLARLLAHQRGTLRLVLLNSCEGARSGQQDVFASTAATLIQSGLPAVLAMQYEITNTAAVEFARTFYEALADNLPVDAAVTDARNAINNHNENSLEWGTPVLHMRATDGVLFAMAARQGQGRQGDKERGDRETGSGGDADSAAAPEVKRTIEPLAEQKPPEAAPHKPVEAPAVIVRPPIDFDWVTIPAGEFWMGSDKKQDPDAYDAELPRHQLYLPAYRIARVPVTVTQFEQFVKATDYKTLAEQQGSAHVYTGSRWKDVEGAYWARPRGPQSDVKQKANHSVTCVAWHDALAFCAWAQVRLPTEAEWEKAARGTDGRIYPWGNDAPDTERCNFNMNVKDTTPVGNYPKCASFYGCLDMAGNVWEWTSSLWGEDVSKPTFIYPYKVDDGRENMFVSENIRRVLRGGSFFNSRRSVRCAYRGRYVPDLRDDDVGWCGLCPPALEPLASVFLWPLLLSVALSDFLIDEFRGSRRTEWGCRGQAPCQSRRR